MAALLLGLTEQAGLAFSLSMHFTFFSFKEKPGRQAETTEGALWVHGLGQYPGPHLPHVERGLLPKGIE